MTPAYVVHPTDRLFAIANFLQMIAADIRSNAAVPPELRRYYTASLSLMASEARPRCRRFSRAVGFTVGGPGTSKK